MYFASCKLISAISLTLEKFQYLFGTDFFWIPVANLGSIVPYTPYCSHIATVTQKKTAIGLLEYTYNILYKNRAWSEEMEKYVSLYNSSWKLDSTHPMIRKNIYRMLRAIRSLQSVLLLDIGNIRAARLLYVQSLPTTSTFSFTGMFDLKVSFMKTKSAFLY